MKQPTMHPVTRVWRKGLTVIIVTGFVAGCPLLTGTIFPFLLVCVQAITLFLLVRFTVRAKKAAQVIKPRPHDVPLIVVLQRRSKRHWAGGLPVERPLYEQYEQPQAIYPEMQYSEAERGRNVW